MKVAYIAAGAGGMYCGSCLRDNALAAALLAQGRDIVLVPAYTPLKTDEASPALDRVVFGGVNVYLHHALPFTRRLPAWMTRALDNPGLTRFFSRFASLTRAESVASLAVDVLRGGEGGSRADLERLARWLAAEIKPDVVNLANSLFSGMAREIRRATGAVVLSTLSGEDSFVSAMPEPYKTEAMEILRRKARDCDGFIAAGAWYAGFMAGFLDVPRERIHAVPLGIHTEGHGPTGPRVRDPFTIAFMARIHPDKGLLQLAEAFILLRKTAEGRAARLCVAGYLDPKEKGYLERVRRRLADGGAIDAFEYVGEVSREEKIRFIQAASVLCVPSFYPEPKGLFVLEALANAVPVVLPRSGSLTELVESTGGGILVKPNDAQELAEGLLRIARNPESADEMGRAGMQAVNSRYTAMSMADAAWSVYETYGGRRKFP